MSRRVRNDATANITISLLAIKQFYLRHEPRFTSYLQITRKRGNFCMINIDDSHLLDSLSTEKGERQSESQNKNKQRENLL